MIEKEHAFKTFTRDLKQGDFGPAVLLYGIEDYLTDWAANSLIDKYVNPATREMDLVKLDEDSTVQEIIESANTFSMFSEKRIVWVKDFKAMYLSKQKGQGKDELQEIKNYLESPNENTLIIFSSMDFDEKTDFNKLTKGLVKSYNFSTLDERTVTLFLEKRLRQNGVEPDKDLSRLIISVSGYLNKDSDYRIYNLINDVDKIVAHAQGGKITEDDVTATLFGDLETFVFDFLDAVSAKKKDVAFKMLHNILNSGTDIYQILGLLINHFELMLEVKEFRKRGDSLATIKDRLKIHEFRIKKAMAYAESFTVEKLKDILVKLYEVDRNIKMGLLSGDLSLELILADM